MKFAISKSVLLASLVYGASVAAASPDLLAREVEMAIDARAAEHHRHHRQNKDGGLTLRKDLVQTASEKNGLEDNPEAGTVASATSSNNFINFCAGNTLTNGLQVKTGSCNGIPMGKIPAVDKVPAVRFKTPANGQNFAANTNFTVEMQVKNINTGAFTAAATTYFAAPANLDGQGHYIGHGHVVIQKVASTTSTEIPDTQTFAFFKGLNDKAQNGILSTVVAGGLPAGAYRACSITSSANHAVVNGPVAQRGSIEDCTIFTVGGAKTSGGNGGNKGGNGNGGNGNGKGGNGKRCDAKRMARKRSIADKKKRLDAAYFELEQL